MPKKKKQRTEKLLSPWQTHLPRDLLSSIWSMFANSTLVLVMELVCRDWKSASRRGIGWHHLSFPSFQLKCTSWPLWCHALRQRVLSPYTTSVDLGITSFPILNGVANRLTLIRELSFHWVQKLSTMQDGPFSLVNLSLLQVLNVIITIHQWPDKKIFFDTNWPLMKRLSLVVEVEDVALNQPYQDHFGVDLCLSSMPLLERLEVRGNMATHVFDDCDFPQLTHLRWTQESPYEDDGKPPHVDNGDPAGFHLPHLLSSARALQSLEARFRVLSDYEEGAEENQEETARVTSSCIAALRRHSASLTHLSWDSYWEPITGSCFAPLSTVLPHMARLQSLSLGLPSFHFTERPPRDRLVDDMMQLKTVTQLSSLTLLAPISECYDIGAFKALVALLPLLTQIHLKSHRKTRLVSREEFLAAASWHDIYFY